MSDHQEINATPTVAPIGRGAGWILDGFTYFKKSPMHWIGVLVLLILFYVVLGYIPIIGPLAGQLLMPVFFGGLMLGCHAQSQGNSFSVNHLFAGFSEHGANLVVLGLLYLLGMIVITIVLVVLLFILPGGLEMYEGLEAGDTEVARSTATLMILVVLTAMALYLPLVMAYWFAPVLIVLHGLKPLNAMMASFRGCLYNILPFLVYGIVALVFFFIAMIPLMLGLLVLFPMLIASVYIAYRDIYLSAT